jgi:uncharacterized protein (TIGR00251 family)
VASWYRRAADGVLSIAVHAQPGAKRTEVAGLHGNALRIRIAAPALEDRANAALVELIAKRLGVAKRDVKIASGEKSREKRVEVRGCAVEPELLLKD